MFYVRDPMHRDHLRIDWKVAQTADGKTGAKAKGQLRPKKGAGDGDPLK